MNDNAAIMQSARLLVEANRLDEADSLLAEAVADAPGEQSLLAMHADIAIRRGAWEEALVRWDAVRAHAPGNAASYVLGARALDELQRNDEADERLLRGCFHCPDDIWVLSVWADHAARREDWPEAVLRWQELRRQFPDHCTVLVQLARACNAVGDVAQAEAHIETAAALFPQDRQVLRLRADLAMQRSNWSVAAQAWEAFRTAAPDDPAGFVLGAQALDRLDLGKEADSVLDLAFQRHPNDIWIASNWARRPTDQRDWTEAARRWRIFGVLHPDDPHWRLHLVTALTELGDTPAAEAALAELLQRFPDNPAGMARLADMAAQRGDWQEATRRWAAVAAAAPEQPDVIVRASRGMSALGHLAEADDLLSQARVSMPSDFSIAVAWAELAMQREVWPEAARRLGEIRERFPDQPHGWLEGARALLRSERHAESEALLNEGRARFPDNRDLLLRWSEMPGAAGDWEGSIARWAEVRAHSPDEPRGYIEGAVALSRCWRGQDGDALLEAALIRLPGVPEIMFYWTLLGSSIHPRDVTLARWDRFRTSFPDHTGGFAFGAHALQDANQPDAAEALITEGLRRFPDHLDVVRAWALIAVRRGDLVTALDRLNGAIGRFPSDLELVRARIDALLSLARHEEAKAALEAARHLWPQNVALLRQSLMLAVQRREMDAAFAMWRSIAANTDFDPRVTRELGWSMLLEDLGAEQASEVLLFLGREPDNGARDWLPVLSEMVRAHGLRTELIYLARDLVRDTAADQFEPATLDVLRSAILLDVSDDDIRHFFRAYLAAGRHALTAKLFCQNYWKAKPPYFERFARLFEQYLTDKIEEASWLSVANSTEILAYLNFAAIFSLPMFRRLITAVRRNADLTAIPDDDDMTNAAGIVANIVRLAPDDDAAMAADDLSAPLARPALATVPQRLRIAVCVSGQMRGYEQAFPTWAQLGLDQHDTRYFAHVWKDIGHNWQRMWVFLKRNTFLWDTFVRPNAIDFLRTRYPIMIEAALRASALGSEVNEQRVSAFYDTPFVRVEDDKQGEFASKNNFWKMHYKIEQAHRLARDAGPFDLMIRFRPDREIAAVSDLDWREIYWRSRHGRTLFVDEGYIYTERKAWLADQFAVGCPEVMDVYADVFADTNRAVQTQRLPLDFTPHFIAHSNLFCLTFYRGISGRTLPGVKFGRLLDPVILSPHDALALIRQDLAVREVDELDRQLVAVCEEEIAIRASTRSAARP